MSKVMAPYDHLSGYCDGSEYTLHDPNNSEAWLAIKPYTVTVTAESHR